RRLAVVDVGDDREVADLLHACTTKGAGRPRAAGQKAGDYRTGPRYPGRRETRAPGPSHAVARYGAVSVTYWAAPLPRCTSSITVRPDSTASSRRSSSAALPTLSLPTAMMTSPCRDRKSTRLNSSHVKISYAV